MSKIFPFFNYEISPKGFQGFTRFWGIIWDFKGVSAFWIVFEVFFLCSNGFHPTWQFERAVIISQFHVSVLNYASSASVLAMELTGEILSLLCQHSCLWHNPSGRLVGPPSIQPASPAELAVRWRNTSPHRTARFCVRILFLRRCIYQHS